MSDYKIEVTDEARASIRSYAGYIEKRSGSWRTAERWVDRVLEAIQTLQYMPDRYELAEEASIRDYAIHRLIIGDYLALYHIAESKRTVNVIGFRHGSRLPRLSELPEDLGQ